ncbi:MAG: ABC transporter substrate-binding protein, partial [Bosea sp. (in: a-proteobacteria)]
MKTPIRIAVAALALAAMGGAAQAQSALKNAKFDPSKLTRENFYDVIVPLAKAEGTVVMYNFAGGWARTWQEGLIKPFEAKYGIKVEYSDVKSDQA